MAALPLTVSGCGQSGLLRGVLYSRKFFLPDIVLEYPRQTLKNTAESKERMQNTWLIADDAIPSPHASSPVAIDDRVANRSGCRTVAIDGRIAARVSGAAIAENGRVAILSCGCAVTENGRVARLISCHGVIASFTVLRNCTAGSKRRRKCNRNKHSHDLSPRVGVRCSNCTHE
jgi:hypothetical protein